MRRDVGNEVIVAIVAVAVLAFALTFGILLSLSSRSPSTQGGTATTPTGTTPAKNVTPAPPTATREATGILENVTVFVPPTLPTNTLSPLEHQMTEIVVQLTKVVETPPAKTPARATAQAVDTDTPAVELSPTMMPSIESSAASATSSPTSIASATATFDVQQALAAAQKTSAAIVASSTPTETQVPTLTNTAKPTATDTLVPANPTPTAVPSDTPTRTPTSVPSDTPTMTPTPKPTASSTSTATSTPTPTLTSTLTHTATVTATPSATSTATFTNTPTSTATPTDTPTGTSTRSPTTTPTDTPMPSDTPTITPTPLRRGDCLQPDGWALYTVQSGNTLFFIARTVGSSVTELSKANCITNANQIRVGEVLFVPRLSATAVQTGVPGSQTLLYASGCTNPSAQITSPKVGDHVQGVFAVYGSASLDDFSYYQIEVRSDAATVYRLYSKSETSVIDGLLATIDTSVFGKGVFWIRLSVANRAGSIPLASMCAIPLIFD